ncbi:MAG: sensor histidine kinase [Vicinamibacterales bacterium]
MRLRIRHLATRFALLLAVAAVVPLLAYGFVSLVSLQRGTRTSVTAGNLNVAVRAGEEIRRYVTNNAEILRALSTDLTGLSVPQKDTILRNYILQFREFREITLYDERGAKVATSRIGEPRVTIPKDPGLTLNGVSMSPVHIDEEMLPTATFAIHLVRLNQPDGWLVGEFSLEEMWRMVDKIRIGDNGYAMVIAPGGELMAHGDPDKKALVAQTTNMRTHPLVAAASAANPAGAANDVPVSLEYDDGDGRSSLGVATRIATLGWTVIVEQPTAEAYAIGTALQRQLIVAISLGLLAMISVGYFFGRSFIRPILKLKSATQEVAKGELETRVDIQTGDEFADLGDAFNTMAGRLGQLQEDVKRQERQAMFGRIAAGIFHDLNHPVQNIGNNATLLVRPDENAEAREGYVRTIQREIATLKRFMDDLRNLSKPKPLERFALDLNSSVREIVEAMRLEGDRQGITVEGRYAPGELTIGGDRFALGRVFRNLITNAIQATEKGGHVTVETSRKGESVEVRVTDTGSGIPPERLAAIFDDFVTTKKRGLGLGLAISKRIVEQLDGTISVQSELGHGTAFTLRFPARDDRAVQAAAS